MNFGEKLFFNETESTSYIVEECEERNNSDYDDKDTIDKINEIETILNKIKSNTEEDELSISQKLQEQIPKQK